MNSLQANESRGNKSIKRMGAKQIKQAVLSDELKQNAQVNGIEISIVELMGWIVSVADMSSNGKRFTLNDGTGSITGFIWSKANTQVKKGTFVKAIGNIGRNTQGEKEITFSCTSIIPVLDGNNLPYHLLMRIVDNLKGEKHENSISESFQVDKKSLENMPERTHKETPHQGSFKRIHLDILKYFSTNQGETGLSLPMVVSTFISSGAYTKTDVTEGVEYLVSAGKLFYCDNNQTVLALVE